MDNSVESKTDSSSPLITSQAAQPPAVKKSILPLSLVIMGITALIFPMTIIIIILPQFSNLINNLGGSSNGFLLLLPVNIFIGVFIAQIFYGISLLRKQKALGGLTALQRKWAVVFFLFGNNCRCSGYSGIDLFNYSSNLCSRRYNQVK